MLGYLCEKYLLYVNACTTTESWLNTDNIWHHYKAEMKSGNMESEPWYERPTVQFSLANEENGNYYDVKNVRLADERGNNLLHKGDFSKGADRWFFSSDHFHLPWHAKNLELNLYFDQGMLGLTAFLLLVIHALARQAGLALSGDMLAATRLSALLGFLMVGLFDSILDFPRLSLLFYLMLFSSLLSSAAPRSAAENGIMKKRRKAK